MLNAYINIAYSPELICDQKRFSMSDARGGDIPPSLPALQELHGLGITLKITDLAGIHVQDRDFLNHKSLLF